MATTSAAALLAGSSGVWACTATVTGTSSGFTNPSGSTIDCIDVTAATVTGNVLNAGTLTGVAATAGIMVENGSILNGTVTNAGQISAPSGWGIADWATITGGIRNSGTITSLVAGVGIGFNGNWQATFGGGIANTGTITSTTADGVGLFVTTFSGGVSNTGTITGARHGVSYLFTTTPTTSSPASTRPAEFSGGIANSGTITGSGGDAIRVTGGRFIAAGFLTAEGTFQNGITNSGTLTGRDNGIYLYSFRSFGGGITNSLGGSITAGTGDGILVDHTASGSSNVSVTNFSGGVTNGGTITAGANGIRLLGINTFTGDVVNSGTITANGGDGIQLATDGAPGATITGTVRNSGTITATGHGILSNVNNLQQGLTNSGTINAGINGIYLQGVTLAGGVLNSGTISGASNGLLVATPFFAGGLTNTGTINGFRAVSVQGAVSFAGGIVNSGTIAGDVAGGLQLLNVGNLNGGITNSGTISSSGGAALTILNGTGTFSGNIVNTGTISGTTAVSLHNNAYALTLLQQGGLISGNVGLDTTQTDTFTITGGTVSGNITGGGTGIVNFSYGAGSNTSWSNTISGTGAINVNSGTVLLQGSWTSAGVSIVGGASLAIGDGATLNSDVTDNGTLAFQQSGAFTYGGVVSGTGVVAQLGNGTTTLTGANTYQGGTTINGGVLAVAADNNLGNAAGGLAFGGGTLRYLGGFTTARAITLNAGGGTFDTNFNNDTLTGSITGPGPLTKAGAGILTLSGASSYLGATNVSAGTLQAGAANAFSPGSAFTVGAGAALDPNGFNQTIGSLAGDGTVTLGTARLTTGGDGTSTTFAGVIGGTGGIDKIGAGALTLTGTNPYSGPTNLSAGALVVNGSLASTVNVVGGILKGNGTIGGLNLTGGTVAPGNSIGTLNVAGNVSFGAASTYQVEANAAGQSDRIVATGNATLTGGTVQVLAQPGGYNSNTSYTILTANGGAGVTGTFAGATSNLAFLTPSLQYPDGHNVILTLSRNSFTTAAYTFNERAVANVLDPLPGSNPLVSGLLGLTLSQAPAVLDALSGEIHASVQSELQEDASLVRQTLLGRLRQASYAGGPDAMAALGYGGPETAYGSADPVFKAMPAARPLNPADRVFWAQGFGAWGSLNGDGNAATLHNNVAGMLSGVDARFGEIWRAGIAGGATFSRATADGRGSANADAAHIAAYGGAQLGGFNARAGAVYSWTDVDTSRTIAFPGLSGQTSARYRASTAQAFGELGYGIRVGPVAVEPFAGLAHVHVSTGAFAETGGFAALAATGRAMDVTYSSLGMRLASQVMLGNGTALIPRVSATWQHAFNDVTPTASLVFQFLPDSRFTVAGVPLARDSALLEAGLDWQITRGAKFGLSYTGEIASQTRRHGAKAGFSWNF